MSKSVSTDQTHAIMAALATNVSWEALDGDLLQNRVIRDGARAGAEFTRFLQNGARVRLPIKLLRKGTSLYNPSPVELVEERVPDSRVYTIWVVFRSERGRGYTAVYVFEHPNGPYILLSSNDKDWGDFMTMSRVIAKEMNGVPEHYIPDRGEDICQTIRLQKVPQERQLWVAEKCITFYARRFSGVEIQAVHFREAAKTASK